MELYLMRHGIADDSQPGQSDEQRKLTAEGKEKVLSVVRMARRGGLNPSLILSSPYVRAMQTAKLVAEVVHYEGDIVPCDSLVPHGSPEDVWRELRIHSDERAILVSSHEPILGQLISFVLNSPALQVEVKKAGITRIDVPGFRGVPRGILQWIITPKIS